MTRPVLPDSYVTPIDGALGLASQKPTGIFGLIATADGGDVDTPVVVTDADQVDGLFTGGRLADALKRAILAGARQIVAVRAATEAAGSVEGPMKDGAGALVEASGVVQAGSGTLSGSLPLTQNVVEVEITTPGDVGVAVFKWRTAGGVWTEDVPTAASVLLTGVCTLAFGGSAFALGDSWQVLVMTDGGLGTMEVDGVPTAAHDVVVTILTGGQLNEAVAIATVDGELTPPFTVQAEVELAAAGVTLAFGAGEPAELSFAAGDKWTFETLAASTSAGALAAAIQALAASPYAGLLEWVHVAEPTDSAMWAAAAALIETEFTSTYKYVHLVMEAAAPDEGETVDEWVTRLLEDAADVAHVRLSVVAGRVLLTDPETGDEEEDNLGPLYSGKLAGTPIQRSIGAPIDGPIALATELRPQGLNDGHIGQLDATGKFITARTIVGLSGLYVTNGRMMVDDTSDYRWVEWRRVMDRACAEVRLAGLRSMHTEADENGLKALVADCEAPLARMQAARKIAGYSVTIPDGQDFIATSEVKVKVRIQPVPTMRWIELEVGFDNPFRGA